MNNDARIGFAGTPEFAQAIVAGLLSGGYRPVVVYTQPDRPKGRGKKQVPSPVKAFATEANIPVETPLTLRDANAQQQLSDYRLDLLVVAAYGLILPQVVLDAPRLGCLNVHASLLPRWRGAAPIERAIMAGDTETGIALMQMDAGLDTGPVHCMVSTAIYPDSTATSIEQTLALLGVNALLDLLPELETSQPTPQNDNGATYASKITSADSQIDWQCSALQIERQVRALCDRAPARSTLNDLSIQVLACAALVDEAGQRLAPGTVVALDKRGLQVATGEGLLNITRVRLNRGQGKPLAAADLRNAYGDQLSPGTKLG